MFERPHHQRIGLLLYALDGELLRQRNCYFGGGTAIALRYGEYRESVDVDFLISDLANYRQLRQLLTGEDGITPLLRAEAAPLKQVREVRADQYGIRTAVEVGGEPVKFEIVLEARIQLDPPAAADVVCGVPTLSPLDLGASKLLANSDRWRDEGVFSRDLIDLAMMDLPLPLLRRAVAKAEAAYGASVLRDLGRAIEWMQSRPNWLERCMRVMDMRLPRALVWKKIRALRRVVPAA